MSYESQYNSNLAAIVTDSSYSDLSSAVVDQISLSFLDTVGVSVAGTASTAGSRAIKAFESLHRATEGGCTVIGSDVSLSLTDAVFVNRLTGHVLDYDDSSVLLPGHPSVVLIPVILGLGEQHDISGTEAILSYAVGFETMVEMARPVPPSHYDNSWHMTATIGTFGTAAAAAKILQLNHNTTVQALNGSVQIR